MKTMPRSLLSALGLSMALLSAGLMHADSPAASMPTLRMHDVDGMEVELFEVDAPSLAVTRLFDDAVPGYHGKGAYTAQGLLVVSNNGEHDGKGGQGFGHHDKPAQWTVSQDDAVRKSPEDRGSLATFDGRRWKA